MSSVSQSFPTKFSAGKWHFLAVGKAGRDAGREEMPSAGISTWVLGNEGGRREKEQPSSNL